jgi:hypothetical protein
MSLAEVEHTLGVRPGYYNLATADWPLEAVAELEPAAIYRKAAADPSSRSYTWDGDGGLISVWIVADKVGSKSYAVPVHPMKVKARNWLRWLRGLVRW